MDKSEQAERYFRWKEYQHSHSSELIEYARKRGFYNESDSIDFILAEAFSRVIAERVIRNNYSDYELYSMPLRHHFDFLLITSDGHQRGIEAKFRLNDIDEYPTDDISLKKWEYNAVVSETMPLDLYYSFYDGNVRVYDLNGKSEQGTWTHRNKTAVDSDFVTDESLKFNPMDNLWTTTTSIPL